jgi:hypothetical protein
VPAARLVVVQALKTDRDTADTTAERIARLIILPNLVFLFSPATNTLVAILEHFQKKSEAVFLRDTRKNKDMVRFSDSLPSAVPARSTKAARFSGVVF